MCQTIKAVEVIRTYSNGSKEIITEVTCKRCSSNGVFQQYKHIDSGKCYECNGTGVTEKKVKVNPTDKVVMVKRTTQVKKVNPTNDHEALKNAMIRINNEHKERKEAIKRQRLEDQKLMEEMNNCKDTFSWDD